MNLSAFLNERYLPHVDRTLKPRTAKEYRRIATALILPKLGNQDIATLSMDDVEDFHRSVPGAVQANRALALLSAVMSFAVERRLISVNPCLGVHRNKEKGREFFYAPEQCKALLSASLAFPDIRGKYIALSLLTGTRPSELLASGPSWRHGRVLRTPDGKTGGRTIYLSDAACAILDSLGETGRYFPEGMDLRRAWDQIIVSAGVPKARLYDLRHTFASSALANGVSLDIIGMMLGHRKRETTLRYAHLAPDIGVAGAAAAAQRMMS